MSDDDRSERTPSDAPSAHGQLRVPRWLLVLVVLAIVAGHGVILRHASSRLALPAVAVVIIVVLLVLTHLAAGRVFQRLSRRRSRP